MSTQVPSWLRIHEVFHPTDARPASEAALVHSLRISLVAGARLTLIRVGPEDAAPADDFPDVRATIERWRTHGTIRDPGRELPVRWHVARGGDPVGSCLKSLARSPSDLIVVATHTHNGKTTWMGKSVAEPLARSSGEMTLLVPEGISGFVRPEDGNVTLKNILVPVANQPRPEPAIEAARRFMLYLPEAGGTATVLHVGDPSSVPQIGLPDVPGWTWNQVVQAGDVVDTILEVSAKVSADVVAMTTEGRNGFLDAFRGSTTERVLRQSRCPILTMPVGSFLG
jgi:nucleotide-binding universal stress UspA family protein